jgi:hypothetical protein
MARSSPQLEPFGRLHGAGKGPAPLVLHTGERADGSAGASTDRGNQVGRPALGRRVGGCLAIAPFRSNCVTARSPSPTPLPLGSVGGDYEVVTSLGRSMAFGRRRRRPFSSAAVRRCSRCGRDSSSAMRPLAASTGSPCRIGCASTISMSPHSSRRHCRAAGAFAGIDSRQAEPGSAHSAGCRSSHPKTPGANSRPPARCVNSWSPVMPCFGGSGGGGGTNPNKIWWG